MGFDEAMEGGMGQGRWGMGDGGKENEGGMGGSVTSHPLTPPPGLCLWTYFSLWGMGCWTLNEAPCITLKKTSLPLNCLMLCATWTLPFMYPLGERRPLSGFD